MTDRKMAEEWVTKNAKHILDTNNAFFSSHEAFLAGYRAGKAELEKENAELKEKYVKNITDCDICDTYCNSQLNTAKEIISEFVEWANWQGNSKCPSFKSIQDKAEQFLSEVEK